MLNFKVDFTPRAMANLRELDKTVAERIVAKIIWLSQNLENVQHIALKGDYADTYKLRVGSWRVLYSINYADYILTIHSVRHRRDIYKA